MGCIVSKLFLDFYIFFIFTRPLSTMTILLVCFRNPMEAECHECCHLLHIPPTFFILLLSPSGVATADFRLVLTSVSSSVTSTSAMSSLTASITLLLGLPVSSFPAVPSSASFLPIIYQSSILGTYKSKPPRSCLSCFLHSCHS